MTKEKTKKDIYIGIFFLALSLLYFIGTFFIQSYNPFGGKELSSKTIPQLLSVVLFILSLSVLIPALISIKKENVEVKHTQQKHNKETIIKLCIAFILLVVYIFLFARLGFVLSSILYLSCIICMLIPKRNKKNIAFTICFSVFVSCAIYVVFSKCLGLILPSGIIPF
ncbi:MAG: tripartite tricarboxylate transporter TctB family protein [Treponema sp.]|nr:tripartite tricarboxylate transporter TctB family protein [Treponema sp.]